MMSVDLNQCVPGQKLLTKHGSILTYVRRLPEESYYDHEIMYGNGSLGTRMNDGFTYKNPDNRMQKDEDIIEVLPFEGRSARFGTALDDGGFPCAITYGNYWVVHLNPGTVRNTENLDGIINILNLCVGLVDGSAPRAALERAMSEEIDMLEKKREDGSGRI